jgi:coenzyme F420-0:L-glutamate ligase/coenzyme F420-1:gamma-L-glutamate ligase
VSKRVELLALETIPRIVPGDDLTGAILAACDREDVGPLQDDVLVVAQKVVSKAEGRIVRLAEVEASPEALRLARISAKEPRIVELILRESEAIVRCVPGLIIVRHRLGVVLANAGIDQSNIGAGDEAETALLWPLDPDASAERLRREIAERRGTTTAVIVNDSLGRAWRKGTVGAAIGISGLAGVVDMRGRADLYGRTLRSTEVGQADEIAAAASLVMGQAHEGRPVVIVRGLAYDQRPASAREITRERELDLFP